MDLVLAIASLTFIVTSLVVAIRVERALPSGASELEERGDSVGSSDGPPRLAA